MIPVKRGDVRQERQALDAAIPDPAGSQGARQLQHAALAVHDRHGQDRPDAVQAHL